MLTCLDVSPTVSGRETAEHLGHFSRALEGLVKEKKHPDPAKILIWDYYGTCGPRRNYASLLARGHRAGYRTLLLPFGVSVADTSQGQERQCRFEARMDFDRRIAFNQAGALELRLKFSPGRPQEPSQFPGNP